MSRVRIEGAGVRRKVTWTWWW